MKCLILIEGIVKHLGNTGSVKVTCKSNGRPAIVIARQNILLVKIFKKTCDDLNLEVSHQRGIQQQD